MIDKYESFAELDAAEPTGSYRTEVRLSGTLVALISPHAGKIEPGTSEICRGIASDHFTYYLFEGCKTSNNRDLHITSSRFDEPRGIEAAQSARVVVTFHGQGGAEQFINVGGLAEQLGNSMIDAFKAEGFSAIRRKDLKLQGRDAKNICNRGSSGQGIQLEISRALRNALLKDNHLMARFASAVRSVLDGL